MSPSSSNSTQPIEDPYDKAIEAYYSGRHDEVLARVDAILASLPQHADALHLRGLSMIAEGNLAGAQEWVERALAISADPNFYNTLYSIQFKLGAFDDALASLRRGLELQPDFAALHYNLGWALQQSDLLDDAVISYRQALSLDPNNASCHNNLGLALQELGALEEAEIHYRRAIALVPDKPSTRHNLGRTLLAQERYEEAWPLYEDRWISQHDAAGHPNPRRTEVALPRWHGESTRLARVASLAASTDARGERLLVLHEQGYGDSLHFVRYLPIALQRFARVSYVCPPALKNLYDYSLRRNSPEIELLDAVPDDLANWDWHCPLMSLPLAFQTNARTIPLGIPYLHADSSRASRWATRLERSSPAGAPRVGLVWAGGHSFVGFDKRRSLTAAQIEPLLTLPHISWISLQKTDDDAKRPSAACRRHLLDWTDDLTDFAETAALIANLDLVISVDTSVAHLAAAMGKPVWLLNRFSGCWRWLNGKGSPWYPGVRLFTQPERGNWDYVLAHVARALQERFAR